MAQSFAIPNVDKKSLRRAIRKEYAEVAGNPKRGFHFHTGRPLAKILGYPDVWIDELPVSAVESFAGTGNPFTLGEIKAGDHVVDIGSGSGLDSLIAARLVGPEGRVIGVDMTPEMLEKARHAAAKARLRQVEFKKGQAESLPVPDGWADVAISNGVVNLCPDKITVFREMYRVLKSNGRLQISDILVEKAVPDTDKSNIDLWTG
ncbi:MAG: methyltransferase domain-containing protein [Proteobacteria bacterium]|nr:methyltransferase domain-containing protein [Pseudomonadota bacterium]